MTTTAASADKRQVLENGTYDVPDVAALLKCSGRHVRRMIDAGEIPGLIRIGRLVRFHKGIVDGWLADQAKP